MRMCEGRIFFADTKNPKMERNIASSEIKGRKVDLDKGEQGGSRDLRKSERSQTQTAGFGGI